MSLRRIRSALFVGTFAGSLVVGCSAQVGDSADPTESSSASVVVCGGFNKVKECTNEGHGGSLVCVCEDLAPIGPIATACTGAIPVPISLAGKGCTAGTWIKLENIGSIPIWECLASATVPPSIGVLGLPPCAYVGGLPVKPTDGSYCAATGATPLLSASCVGNAPPGYTYIYEYPVGNISIGTNCGGGCSRLAGP